jgi:mono/diheme cytochrome c family protein
MTTPLPSDPRVDPAAITDDNLLAAHEKLLGKQPDEKGHYRLLPLNILFFLSGLVMFGGTYIGRYAGHFDPLIYNENVKHGAKMAPPPPIDQVAVGKSVYATVCAACHQPTGLGLPPAFPPLAGSEWVAGSEERMIRIILHGLQGPIKVKGAEFVSAMPATGPGSGFNLSPEKVAAVATYVRQEWGNSAPPISAEKVAEIRAKEGNHAAWTVADLEKLP